MSAVARLQGPASLINMLNFNLVCFTLRRGVEMCFGLGGKGKKGKIEKERNKGGVLEDARDRRQRWKKKRGGGVNE